MYRVQFAWHKRSSNSNSNCSSIGPSAPQHPRRWEYKLFPLYLSPYILSLFTSSDPLRCLILTVEAAAAAAAAAASYCCCRVFPQQQQQQQQLQQLLLWQQQHVTGEPAVCICCLDSSCLLYELPKLGAEACKASAVCTV